MRRFIALLAFASSAVADIHEVWWNITYVQGVNPDGLAERRVIGVNGSWPYVISLLFPAPLFTFFFTQHTGPLRYKSARTTPWLSTPPTPSPNPQLCIIMACSSIPRPGTTAPSMSRSGKLSVSTTSPRFPDTSGSGIPPGQSLDYHVPTDTSGQWGTYWVHGHAYVHPSLNSILTPF